MLYKKYLGSFFLKKLLFLSAIFTLVLFTFQVFQYIYLFFSLPLDISFSFLILLLIYNFHLAVALAIFPSLAEVIFYLSENRIFYVLYNFGINDRLILKSFYKPLLVVSILGLLAGFFINYQKISYFSKYLKFKFGERVLLTVPENSFASFEKFSVYFERKKHNKFKNFLIKTDTDLATAKIAELYPDKGILVLKKTSIFKKMKGFNLLMKGEEYRFNLIEPYSYSWKSKGFWENLAFTSTIYLIPLLLLVPFFRKTKLKFSRLQVQLWGLFYLIIQFSIALALKAII
jgi:hypothetical protein